MKPAAFEYHAPDSLEEALALLAQHGDEARPLAGGQSLVPTMNFRLAAPAVLVDLNRIPELRGIQARADPGAHEGGPGVEVLAMTRQREVERSESVARQVPLLHEAMPFIAHPQIRNRGTLGGSLAHADPAAELPAVAVALDATLHLSSTGGSRTVAAGDFYIGLFETALEPGELLTRIDFHTPPDPSGRRGHGFGEVARRHGDYALAGVAVHLVLDSEARIEHARIVLFSVGEGPTPAIEASGLLRGQRSSPELLAEVAQTAAHTDISPHTDIHASERFRRHLAGVIVRRAVERALARALRNPTG